MDCAIGKVTDCILHLLCIAMEGFFGVSLQFLVDYYSLRVLEKLFSIF
jgi:hypothetical protein